MSCRTVLLQFAAVAVLCIACRDAEDSAKAPPKTPTPAAQTPIVVAPERLDILQLLPTCEVSHLGLSIDVGTTAAEAQRSYAQIFAKDVIPIQHGRARFAEVSSRRIDYHFWLSEPLEELFVSGRVRGRRSGRMAVYVDGKRLGGAGLAAEEARVVTFKRTESPLTTGRHQLTLQFSRGESTDGPYAEIEWLRLAARGGDEETYAAPTLDDIVSDVVLQKRPRRALALREQSSVRCPIWPAPDARLKLWLGFWGNGSGRAEIRVLRQNEVPVTLEQRELKGGETAGWTPVDLALGAYAGELVGVEFAVRQASGVGRISFGDPELTRKKTTVRSPRPSPTVLLIVLAGLRRASLPPWGPKTQLPAFGELVRAGTAFTKYRVPSSVPGAVLASMLSGLTPRAHTVEDQAARLPQAVHTVNEALKQASGHAAMFTGVPTSFPAFGFARSWDEHEAISPVTDEPAHAPFERAEAWLKRDAERVSEHGRLVVIHARGAHPPWDVSKAEAAQLKPEEYTGAIDARRGGIALAEIRTRSRPSLRYLSSDDWTRVRALELAALKKQDAALARLVKTLQELSLWEDALVIVAGDVAAGEPPVVPYHPAGPLEEHRLFVPLIVKFPGRELAGRESGVPATAVDIAATVLHAFGMQVPKDVEGLDLHALASGHMTLAGRPMLATHGLDFATRLGPWRLSGKFGETPTLCELAVDPACVNDVFATKGFVSDSLWKWTYLAERAARVGHPVTREPATVDAETAAALAVWGDDQ